MSQEQHRELSIPRHQFPIRLIQKFSQEYDEMLTHYPLNKKIELTEHLLQALDYISEFAKTNDEKDYKKYVTLEDELLKKYRANLNPYARQQFFQYFDFERVMVIKFLLSAEDSDVIKPGEQRLTPDEIEWFLNSCQRLLYNSRHYLYLQDHGDNVPAVTLNAPVSIADEPDKGMTKARQLLAIYYFLKASLGIEGRDSSSISGIARFIHMLTGTKFTTVQNSDIYKKYLQMPNYKKDNQLITDLKFIRPYFVDLGLDSAVKMIDEEINRAINELPFGERKKYKND